MMSGESVDLKEGFDKAKAKLVKSFRDPAERLSGRIGEGQEDSVLTLRFNPRTRNEHMIMVSLGVFVTVDPFEETIIMIEIAEFRHTVDPYIVRVWDKILDLEKDSKELPNRTEEFAFEIIEQIFSEDEES